MNFSCLYCFWTSATFLESPREGCLCGRFLSFITFLIVLYHHLYFDTTPDKTNAAIFLFCGCWEVWTMTLAVHTQTVLFYIQSLRWRRMNLLKPMWLFSGFEIDTVNLFFFFFFFNIQILFTFGHYTYTVV